MAHFPDDINLDLSAFVDLTSDDSTKAIVFGGKLFGAGSGEVCVVAHCRDESASVAITIRQ